MEEMHYLGPIDDAINSTEAKIAKIGDSSKSKKQNEADFKQLESKIDKEIESETSLLVSEDAEEDLASAEKAENEKSSEKKDEVKNIKFEGHKLRAEIS